MGPTRTGGPRTAPVPLTRRSRRPGADRFWEQSFGKTVGHTATMFGAGSSPRCPDTVLHPLDPELDQALAGTAPGCPETVSGDRWAALQTAASTAVRVRRATAADQYVLHRAYPSARSLFGVDLEEVAVDGAYRIYLPWSASTGPGPADAQPVPGTRPALTARLRPERFPSSYGSLRSSLARLEAGHLLATVAAAAHHLGLQPATRLDASAGEAGRMTEDDGDPQMGWLIPGAVLPGLVRRSATTTVSSSVRAPQRLDEWFARRTSGPSDSNLVTAHAIPAEQLLVLDSVVAEGLRAVRHLVHSDALVVHRCTIPGRAMSARTMTPVGADGVGATLPMPATGRWTSAVGLTWSIDPGELSRAGSEVLETVHVLLGWLCQWVCLAAAHLGIAARPVRNFDEATWAHDLGLPPSWVPAYQLWLHPLSPIDLTPAAWTTHGRTL